MIIILIFLFVIVAVGFLLGGFVSYVLLKRLKKEQNWLIMIGSFFWGLFIIFEYTNLRADITILTGILGFSFLAIPPIYYYLRSLPKDYKAPFWHGLRRPANTKGATSPQKIEVTEAQDFVEEDRSEEPVKDEGKTEVPIYFDTPSFSSKIMDNIVYFLRNRNYETVSFNRYIVAWHKQRPHRLLLKIEDPENCEQYREFGAMILPYYKFRQLIPKFERATEGGFPDTSQLNTDVITSFGWHAYADVETRHRALECASDVWGPSHILNLLGWLRNTWPNNPKLSRYADVVEADYYWFERECCTSVYRRRRIRLIEKIRSELVKLGIPPMFQKFFGNVDAYDRCFIITP